MGSDLLADTYESITVFADGSWTNEYAFYDVSRSQIKYYTDKTYTVDELIEINTKVSNKILYSSLQDSHSFLSENSMYKHNKSHLKRWLNIVVYLLMF